MTARSCSFVSSLQAPSHSFRLCSFFYVTYCVCISPWRPKDTMMCRWDLNIKAPASEGLTDESEQTAAMFSLFQIFKERLRLFFIFFALSRWRNMTILKFASNSLKMFTIQCSVHHQMLRGCFLLVLRAQCEPHTSISTYRTQNIDLF